ncbi:MAG: DUF4919 domain-containing protein [Crocinitomicaceae bacterium]
MKKFALIFLLAVCSHLLQAQHVSQINFNKIKENITDSSSNFFYPKLLKKIEETDTTLLEEEYFHLYYGNVFQEGYYPYGTSHFKKDFLDAYESGNYEQAFEKGEVALNAQPVDLELLLKMSILSFKLEKVELKRKFAGHFYAFLDVIYRSGDGKSLETAYVVTSVDHEYFIAGDLGLRVVHQQLVNDCDLLFFSKRDQKKIKGRKKIKRLYFNVRMPLMSLSKSFKDVDLPDPDEE